MNKVVLGLLACCALVVAGFFVRKMVVAKKCVGVACQSGVCQNVPVTNGDVNKKKGYSDTVVAEKRCPKICKKQEEFKKFHGEWNSDEAEETSFCKCCKE